MINESKKELIEEFAAHYIEAYGLAPLAAKIYAYLLMDCKREGKTFDELVEVFNVSKSSVSNSLHLLSQHKHIEQFTKIDQRKRLYRISPEHIILRLKKIHTFLLREKYLSEKYKCYREDNSVEINELHLKGSQIYSEHLNKCIAQMSETVEKLEQLNQNI
ncbi:hypothetical protein [Moheibacter sediminis]|uniref:hypothetical protein n=1 Tax=Moheibacter sediminis TaxID=1434700 RepID=UPI0009FFD210|nr:hypothetical protein [Moheibacter sediminis]